MKTVFATLFFVMSNTAFATETFVKVICQSNTTRETIVNKYVNSVRINEKKLEGFLYSPMSIPSEAVFSVELSKTTCVIRSQSNDQMR